MEGYNQASNKNDAENLKRYSSESISTLVNDDKAAIIGEEDVEQVLHNLPALLSMVSLFLISKTEAVKVSDIVKEVKIMDIELQEKIQKYINAYRNLSSNFLPVDTGQRIKVVGFDSGILLEIESGSTLSNSDHFFGDVDTIEMAFSLFQKKLTPAAINFKAPIDETSIEVGNSIFIIKGKEDHFWEKEQSYHDVDAIVEVVEKVIENKKKSILEKEPKNKGNERKA